MNGDASIFDEFFGMLRTLEYTGAPVSNSLCIVSCAQILLDIFFRVFLLRLKLANDLK